MVANGAKMGKKREIDSLPWWWENKPNFRWFRHKEERGRRKIYRENTTKWKMREIETKTCVFSYPQVIPDKKEEEMWLSVAARVFLENLIKKAC